MADVRSGDHRRAGGPAPFWFLVMAGVAVIIVHLAVVWTAEGRGLAMVSARVLLDTDAYMWMNRVLHIWETGDWFDHSYPRVDPPEGHTQHWTRPLDGLLLLGGVVLGWIWGFRDGLYYWGFLMPPMVHLVTMASLVWAVQPLLRRQVLEQSAVPLVILVFVVQIAVFQVFLAGRPDHHAVLACLYVLYLGAWLRVILDGERAAGSTSCLGIVAALAIWVNVEALVFVALGMAGMALSWVLGSQSMGKRGTIHGLFLTAGLLVGLLVEWGSGPFPAREMDTLSVAHIALMGFSTVFWAWIWLSSERNLAATPAGRLGIASAGAAVVLALLVLVFPEFLQNPLGDMDPLYHETRLSHILELQPLHTVGQGFWSGLGAVIMFAGIGILVLPYLGLRVMRKGPSDERVVWLMFGVAAALYLLLALSQRRWSDYLVLTAVIPYAVLVKEMFGRVGPRVGAPGTGIARPATLFMLLLGPLLLGGALFAAGSEVPSPPSREGAGFAAWEGSRGVLSEQLPVTPYSMESGSCDLAQLGAMLSNERWFPRSTLVLAHTDAGPELLFRTPHSVLSIPNHRPQPGYRLTRDIMGHPDAEAAASMLRERGVGILVLCARDIEGGFFDFPEPSFAGWLAEGGIPEGYALHASNRFVRIYRREG